LSCKRKQATSTALVQHPAHTQIPNLVTLVLTDNAIATLGALLPLADLPALRHLVLRGNPVTSHEHYTNFVLCKAAGGKLHTLDFERVTDAARSRAIAALTDAETGRPNELAIKLSVQNAPIAAGTAARRTVAAGGKGRLMTPEEKKRVLAALTRAQTAEEVRKLERMLADGLIPEGETVEVAA
jgi:U2 small nuclear ribonucleoprotein A'